eukprot:COSAG04_NODE_9600_length_848_cov_4.253672_1_plen_55_part_01
MVAAERSFAARRSSLAAQPALMRTLHDFFQPTSRATGADAVVSAPSSSAAPAAAA